MDFTYNQYKALLQGIKNSSFKVVTYFEYCSNIQNKTIILRHDVDKNPHKALEMARIEAEFDIVSTYYFRKSTFDETIIKEIVALGHEVGYHYEELAICNGDIEKAIEMFNRNISFFRSYIPIKTIAMHGSPMSKFDNRSLWKKNYHYSNFDIIAEPYFDFIGKTNHVYFTDTGRSWNSISNIRDVSQSVYSHQLSGIYTTRDLITYIHNDPKSSIMISIHPQRWNSSLFFWLVELIWQNTKNIVKRYVTLQRN